MSPGAGFVRPQTRKTKRGGATTSNNSPGLRRYKTEDGMRLQFVKTSPPASGPLSDKTSGQDNIVKRRVWSLLRGEGLVKRLHPFRVVIRSRERRERYGESTRV